MGGNSYLSTWWWVRGVDKDAGAPRRALAAFTSNLNSGAPVWSGRSYLLGRCLRSHVCWAPIPSPPSCSHSIPISPGSTPLMNPTGDMQTAERPLPSLRPWGGQGGGGAGWGRRDWMVRKTPRSR